MTNKTKKLCLYTSEAFFTALAFSSSTTAITHQNALELTDGANAFSNYIAKLQLNYTNGYGINISIIFILIAYFFYHVNKNHAYSSKRLSIISSFAGLLFSFFTIIGFRFLHNVTLFSSIFQSTVTIINYLGYYFLFKNIFKFIIFQFENFSNKNIEKQKRAKHHNKMLKTFSTLFKKHPILFFMFALLIFWLPYLVIFYPGTMNCDSLNEIHEYWRIIEWTTHHPIFPTIVYGSFMTLGRFLVNDNFGLFLNNITQVILSAFLLSYALNYTYKLTKSKKIIFGIFAYFALFPTWPIHFYTEVKDIWFTISFFAFIIFSMKFIQVKGKFTKTEWLIYIASMIFTYLFRNNGVFVILFTLPFLVVIAQKTEKKKIIAFSLLSITLCILFTKIYTSINDIKKGSISEALAIPLQQTALYIRNYELNEEEYNNINKIIDIHYFIDCYNPELVDALKEHYKDDTATTEDLKNYFITWFKMFFKHPNIYVKSFFNGCYGYLYPDRKEYKDGVAHFTIDAKDNFAKFNLCELDLQHLDKTAGLRDNIVRLVYLLRNIPFIGLLFSCGFYTWLLILLTLILVYYKKIKDLIILIPLYVILLVCIASPVNSCVRYMLPIMISLPFIYSWLLYNSKN